MSDVEEDDELDPNPSGVPGGGKERAISQKVSVKKGVKRRVIIQATVKKGKERVIKSEGEYQEERGEGVKEGYVRR